MSEDKTTAVEETVSETPAIETTQDSSNEQYIAESKKYRKRAQDAENRLAKLEKSLARAEEDKLKEKEEFKTLYEKASSEVEGLSANAEKWAKYEEVKRNSLLENHPEVIPVFQKHNMGCIGCIAASFEKLSDIAVVHGIDVKKFVEELNEVAEHK